MTRSNPMVDLIAGLSDVLMPTDARTLVDRSLAILVADVPGAHAAVFSRDAEGMQLFAARNIDQGALDAGAHAWRAHRERLDAGREIVVRRGDAELDGALSSALVSREALALVPVSYEGRVVGLVYLDSQRPLADAQLATARRIADVVGIALRARPTPTAGILADYLERASPDDVQRDQLILQLARNEWNISRVARILGVTRRTIYLRLERFGIERRRVPKGIPRRREAT
jgi:transcriptional regulator with GAF, ATPase, and Fis domain